MAETTADEVPAGEDELADEADSDAPKAKADKPAKAKSEKPAKKPKKG